MSHRSRLCGTKLVAMCYSSLLHSSTMQETLPSSHSTHIVNNSTHIATIVDLSPTIARLSISFHFFFFFNFYLFFFPHWLPILFFIFPVFLLASRCGFLFFLSFVRVTWDGILLSGSRGMGDKSTIVKR